MIAYRLNLHSCDYVIAAELIDALDDSNIPLPLLNLVQTPEDATSDGCPVLTHTRHVAVGQGVQGTVEWQLRTRNGDPVLLTIENPSTEPDAPPYLAPNVVVRFRSCDDCSGITQISACVQAPPAAIGMIKFVVPTTVTNYCGVYRAEIGVGLADGTVLFTEPWLLFVERGMFGDEQYGMGPPTLTEIRMAMRDSEVENTLLQSVEFSADEIVYAITRPIAEWNECPPSVGHYTTSTFPYRENWLKAIISILLQTAVHHYMRNKLPSSHGGLTVNDKEKDREYQGLASMYRQEWKDFMMTQKVAMNASLCWGTLGSSYGQF